MAIGAGHLAGRERVGRDLVGLRTLCLVAGKADFALGLLVAHLVVLGMHLVAGVTSHIVTGMLTSFPMRPLVTLVASVTRRIAIGG